MPRPWSQIDKIIVLHATSDTPELADNVRQIFFFYSVLYTTGTPQKRKEITGTARHALQKKISLPGFSRKSLFFMYAGHRPLQKSSYRVFRPAVGKCAMGREKNTVSDVLYAQMRENFPPAAGSMSKMC